MFQRAFARATTLLHVAPRGGLYMNALKLFRSLQACEVGLEMLAGQLLNLCLLMLSGYENDVIFTYFDTSSEGKSCLSLALRSESFD